MDADLRSPSTPDAIRRLADRARALGQEPVRFPQGACILEEGATNESLFILLDGTAELSKTAADGGITSLDLLGPGSLLGILSFWTGRSSFTAIRAVTPLLCLRLSRDQFEREVAEDPAFARITQELLVVNLSDRYRRVVGLTLKVGGLTRELEAERNALREALVDLETTRNQLVHREKLAVMGQLLAGIAHEINNPSSSLLQSVEQLGRLLPALFTGERSTLFEEGRAAPYLSTQESRERLESLQNEFSSLPRSLCRRVSRLTPAARNIVDPDLRANRVSVVEHNLGIFEMGAALRGIQIADDRITRLVKSLKSYSRQDEGSVGRVDIETCVRDTLMVLNHRLKHYDLRLELADLPEIPARAGEINQILTNLLTNACDATAPGKQILLRSGRGEARVWIEVADEGHGIPAHLLEKIFEPNVTTKSGGGQFGLGLGLAISRDLARQHQGQLFAANRPEGGAIFRLELPLETST
jgi:signal transduction histidine kinase